MKSLFENISKIEKQIKKNDGAMLLLDFDGVLSAIALTPDEAFISEENKGLVKKCMKFFPVAIITGRELSEIKGKMGIKNILYIASHGLEWEKDGKYFFKSVQKNIIQTINLAKNKIKMLAKRYPGMILESKNFMFAVHYRKMTPKLAESFVKEVISILKPITKNHKLRLDHNLKTFELRPHVNWDKGDSALFVVDYFNKKTKKRCTPIFIGDGLTDEDAFRALKKNGITIRVGQNRKSLAKWYLRDQKEVQVFLEWLLSLYTNNLLK